MPILAVKNLCTSIFTQDGEVKAVNNVSFELERGEILGIVGESGSGKSMTAYSIMQILPPFGKLKSGSILFDSLELVGADEKTMRKIRGNRISIIFQDPMTSLNPTYTVGNQLVEAVRIHTDKSKAEAEEKAIDLLRLVQINEPEKRMKQYPYELSGGMRQRVMIAMALSCEPDILIADEPTTALDVTIQAEILDLIKKLRNELRMSVIIITHDLGVVAELCDKVVVMYGGEICEKGTVNDLFNDPQHEYTKGLLSSVPTISSDGKPLKSIPGTPVNLLNLPQGCPFAQRCEASMKICLRKKAPEMVVNSMHMTSCWAYYKNCSNKQNEGFSFKSKSQV